jgi:hypothetical protein
MLYIKALAISIFSYLKMRKALKEICGGVSRCRNPHYGPSRI